MAPRATFQRSLESLSELWGELCHVKGEVVHHHNHAKAAETEAVTAQASRDRALEDLKLEHGQTSQLRAAFNEHMASYSNNPQVVEDLQKVLVVARTHWPSSWHLKMRRSRVGWPGNILPMLMP